MVVCFDVRGCLQRASGVRMPCCSPTRHIRIALRQATVSDYYTHVRDIPPQYGDGYFDVGPDVDAARETIDGGCWRLPLSVDASSLEPLTAPFNKGDDASRLEAAFKYAVLYCVVVRLCSTILWCGYSVPKALLPEGNGRDVYPRVQVNGKAVCVARAPCVSVCFSAERGGVGENLDVTLLATVVIPEVPASGGGSPGWLCRFLGVRRGAPVSFVHRAARDLTQCSL